LLANMQAEIREQLRNLTAANGVLEDENERLEGELMAAESAEAERKLAAAEVTASLKAVQEKCARLEDELHTVKAQAEEDSWRVCTSCVG
jgi:chromosome segregation ATPase